MNHSSEKAIAGNYAYSLLLQCAKLAIPMVTVPFVSRALGSHALGVYSYTYSCAVVFSVFIMLGLASHGSRTISAVADDPENLRSSFCRLYSIQLTASALIIACYVCFVFLFVSPEHRSVALSQTLFLMGCMTDVTWALTGTGKFRRIALTTAAFQSGGAVMTLLLVHSPDDLLCYTLIQSAVLFAENTVLFLSALHDARVSLFDYRIDSRELYSVLLLSVPSVSAVLFRRLDKIILGFSGLMEATGSFANAEKIVQIPVFAVSALGSVMLPAIASLAVKRDKKTIARYTDLSMELIFLIASGASFGLCAVIEPLSRLVFGKDFAAVPDIARILTPTILLISWSNVLRTEAVIPQKKDNVYVLSNVLGASVNLIANAVLIPRFGYSGAAASEVFSELTVAVCLSAALSTLPLLRYLLNGLWYLAAGVLMYGMIGLTGLASMPGILPLAGAIAAGAVFYLLITIPKFILHYRKVRHAAASES